MSVTAIGSTIDPTQAQAIRHKRLEDAAQQFEGMLLQEMLKPLKNSESEDSDKAGDTMRDFGTEAVAGAMAKSGAFGIAHRLVAQVEHLSAKEKSS